MKTLAEGLRWAGLLTIVIGAAVTIIFTIYSVLPYAATALRWSIDNFGIPAIGGALFFIGMGLFHLGEWVSPFKKPNRS